ENSPGQRRRIAGRNDSPYQQRGLCQLPVHGVMALVSTGLSKVGRSQPCYLVADSRHLGVVKWKLSSKQKNAKAKVRVRAAACVALALCQVSFMVVARMLSALSSITRPCSCSSVTKHSIRPSWHLMSTAKRNPYWCA